MLPVTGMSTGEQDAARMPTEPHTLSEALQEAEPVMAHSVVSWHLVCGHAIKCHCRHEVHQMAYCWYCGTWREVASMEVTRYNTRSEAMAGGFSVRSAR